MEFVLNPHSELNVLSYRVHQRLCQCAILAAGVRLSDFAEEALYKCSVTLRYKLLFSFLA